MVYFQTQNPYLGMFWSALEYTSLAYFVAIRNILQTFGMLHGHLVYFVANLVYFVDILVYFWFVASRKIWQPWRHKSFRWSHLFALVETEAKLNVHESYRTTGVQFPICKMF
jgi:hypothetical protein